MPTTNPAAKLKIKPSAPFDPDEYAELGTRLAEGAQIVADMQALRSKIARFMARLDVADQTIEVLFSVHEELDTALDEFAAMFGQPKIYGHQPRMTVVA